MTAVVEGRDATEILFEGRTGDFLPLGEFRWAFDLAAEATGLDGLVPHGLRHTAASLAISGGANIKVIQRMLGHKTATLALDLYGHLFLDDLDLVADAMNLGALSTAGNLRTTAGAEYENLPEDADLPA